MGINSNFDSSFLSPSLPPPQPSEAEGKKDLPKNAQNPVREGKERKDVSDGSQVYNDNGQTTEFEHKSEESHEGHGNEQGGGGQSSDDHQGSGGGGSSSGGDGQSDKRGDEGTFSFLEALENLGVVSPSDRKSATQVTVKGEAQIFSQDDIVQIESNVQFKDKYNLGSAFSAASLSHLKADSPDLPSLKSSININEAIKEIKGNPWLNTSYMTAITDNLLKVARAKMEMQLVEGPVMVAMLNVIADLGLALGDLALKKAELEAEMHMFQAMAAFLSFGVTLAAGALSVAGLAASATGGAMKTNASTTKDPASSSAAASGKPIGGQGFTGSERSFSPNSPLNSSRSSSSTDSSTPSTTPTNSSRGLGSEKAGESNLNIGSSAQRGTRTWTKSETPNSSRASGEFSPSGSAEERGGLAPSFGKSKKTDAEGFEGVPLTKKEARAIKNANFVDKGGEMVGSLGHTLVTGSGSLGTAADNLVQWAYLPLIGAKEREIQILQSAKQIAQQALESASNDFKGATADIEAVLQALMKIQDETSRAHNMQRG